MFAICCMGLMAIASANIYEMNDASAKQCEVAHECYVDKCESEQPLASRKLLGDKNDKADCTRIGFFNCFDDQLSLESKSNKQFRHELNEVFDGCEEHEKKDANGKDVKESKHVKCMIKKVKKDACDWYFSGEDVNEDAVPNKRED